MRRSAGIFVSVRLTTFSFETSSRYFLLFLPIRETSVNKNDSCILNESLVLGYQCLSPLCSSCSSCVSTLLPSANPSLILSLFPFLPPVLSSFSHLASDETTDIPGLIGNSGSIISTVFQVTLLSSCVIVLLLRYSISPRRPLNFLSFPSRLLSTLYLLSNLISCLALFVSSIPYLFHHSSILFLIRTS